MRPFFPWVVLTGTLVAGAAGIAVLGVLALTFGRPPQPLTLGTIQWLGEVGATVDSVERSDRIGAERAKGVFYIVHARIIAPFGLRPTWHDSDVEVRTFSGSGGTMHGLRFAVAAKAQALLDKRTGRPGPIHLVRGATQHEDLVFDLPMEVEQPGLLFLPANDPMGLVEWIFGVPWQPHRFNLRFD